MHGGRRTDVQSGPEGGGLRCGSMHGWRRRGRGRIDWTDAQSGSERAAPCAAGARRRPADELREEAGVLLLELLGGAAAEVMERPAVLARVAGLRGLVHAALDVVVARLGGGQA
jgi:hypothetical protein